MVDPAPPGEAPHFTKELLLDALRHLRADFAASLSGEGGDDRARSRLEGARALGLDRLADDAVAAIDRGIQEIGELTWPGGLDQRYLGLIGAIDALADMSTSLLPHDAQHAHLTELAEVMALARQAAGSGHRKRLADRLRGLYVIVDPELTRGRDPTWVAEQALAGGATALQLRVKSASKGDWLPLALDVLELCEAAEATLIVNDHPDVAVATRAHGVHLGQHDLPLTVARRVLKPWQIAGTSNALLEEAVEAYDQGADYIAVGRMFPTGSKSDTRPAGPETLRRVREHVPAGGPPLIAIGGITVGNAGAVAAAGADGICVIAAVTGADDPREAARALLAAFREGG